MLSEVGAVALKSVGRRFERGFVRVERVLNFVADPFPWEEVEAFADALMNKPELALRVLPANRPADAHSPFDYEVMRTQARARAQQEMTTLERLATIPGLVNRRFGGGLYPIKLANGIASLSSYPSAKILQRFLDSA